MSSTTKTPAKAGFRDVICGEHQEGSYYLMVFTAAEERGGSSKPCGLLVPTLSDGSFYMEHEGEWH